MKIEITKYENPVIVEGEIVLLHHLADSIKEEKEVELVVTLLQQKDKQSKSGIYAGIEIDIKAFYELDQSNVSSWVLKPKFREYERDEIKELLIKRILSVKEGTIELPEQIFELKTFRIKIDNRFVDVEEITRRHWEYIIYKSINYKNEYFADIVFDGIAAFNRYFKLDNTEIKIVESGNEEEITKMINSKRMNNWR